MTRPRLSRETVEVSDLERATDLYREDPPKPACADLPRVTS